MCKTRAYRRVIKVEPTVAAAGREPSPVWTERNCIYRLIVMCKYFQARARVGIPQPRRGVE